MYTESMERTLVEKYTANPSIQTVKKLAVELNRTPKSIIGKLVKMGVYVTAGYTDKLGRDPTTKLQLVRKVEEALDIKLPGLDKAPKETLRVLAETVEDMAYTLEDAYEEKPFDVL